MMISGAGVQTKQEPSKPDPSPPESPKPPTDDKLGEKLIRRAEGSQDENIMEKLLQLMYDVAKELQLDFDTGEETQRMQQQIVSQLNEAIKIAAAQRRASRSGGSSSSDTRRMSQAKPGRTERGRGQPQDGKVAGEPSTASPPGSMVEGVATSGELRESRRSWGHLPMRAREEIIQGVGERFLERYREWVERYYRALQESDE